MSASQTVQGLIDLARRTGVEIRPTLLRVLTDLYVQKSTHNEAEAGRFSELACRLLDSTDMATRRSVAQRLAAYPATPKPVVIRLARDEIAVAEPILRQSIGLDEADLNAILDLQSPTHALAIGARADLPESVAARLRTLHGVESAAADSAASEEIQAAAGKFLDGDERERLEILCMLERATANSKPQVTHGFDAAIAGRLEQAAWRHAPKEFSEILTDALGIPAETADRIVADRSGEAAAVVLRALGAAPELAERVFLLLNPAVGQSVTRVFRLAKLYRLLEPAAARQLLAAFARMPRQRRAHMPQVARDQSDRYDPRAPLVDSRLPSAPGARRIAAGER